MTLLILAFFIAAVAGWAYHDPVETGLLGGIFFILLLSAKSFGFLAWLNPTKLLRSSTDE